MACDFVFIEMLLIIYSCEHEGPTPPNGLILMWRQSSGTKGDARRLLRWAGTDVWVITLPSKRGIYKADLRAESRQQAGFRAALALSLTSRDSGQSCSEHSKAGMK